MSATADDLQELRAALRADAAEVAEALLGPPNKGASTRRTLRWGSKGGLAVEVRGPKAGLWHDFDGGNGGDLLDLIRHTHRCDFPAALAWARNWTGEGAQPTTARPHPSPDPHKAAEAERARRIATAQRIATGGVPLAGTLGACYLKQVHGIPEPAGGCARSARLAGDPAGSAGALRSDRAGAAGRGSTGRGRAGPPGRGQRGADADMGRRRHGAPSAALGRAFAPFWRGMGSGPVSAAHTRAPACQTATPPFRPGCPGKARHTRREAAAAVLRRGSGQAYV